MAGVLPAVAGLHYVEGGLDEGVDQGVRDAVSCCSLRLVEGTEEEGVADNSITRASPSVSTPMMCRSLFLISRGIAGSNRSRSCILQPLPEP